MIDDDHDTREEHLAREHDAELDALRTRLAAAEKALAEMREMVERTDDAHETEFTQALEDRDAMRDMLDRIAQVNGVEFDPRCEECIADGVEGLADHAKEMEAERDAARAELTAMQEVLRVARKFTADPDSDAVTFAARFHAEMGGALAQLDAAHKVTPEPGGRCTRPTRRGGWLWKCGSPLPCPLHDAKDGGDDAVRGGKEPTT